MILLRERWQFLGLGGFAFETDLFVFQRVEYTYPSPSSSNQLLNQN